MGWTDVYPVFGDESIDQYFASATAEERADIELLLGIDRVINKRDNKFIVSTSLFWKNANLGDEDIPIIDREHMIRAREFNLVTRYDPWKHYVEPLMAAARLLSKMRPDVSLRVYLASDLHFLIDDLAQVGCEIYLMKSSSIRHNPGAMWRFLAAEEDETMITIVDSDRGENIMNDLARTEALYGSHLSLWRVAYSYAQRVSNSPGNYRPIMACHFGIRGGLPVKDMLSAFIWHSRSGDLANSWKISFGERTIDMPIFGADWPSYGFDEWFLLAALYPRAARGGIITFLSAGEVASPWFSLDIEYATWACRDSCIVLYPHSPNLPFGNLG